MDFSTLVQALQDPRVYPDRPLKVELIQTHISAIFLTGKFVYKVKKPVNFGFLDFTTLEKRRYYCEEEVRLNRRLSPEVYLGVVEIRSQGGAIALGTGPGEVMEYAVWMKQLPEECLMDSWLSRGTLTPAVLERLAAKIAHFHAQAASGPEISAFGVIGVIRQNVEENFAQTEKYVDRSLSPQSYDAIRKSTRRFLEKNPSLFRQRIAHSRIRDCHGDLHLKHICLNEKILIFDCIEFNERFRYSDVAADLAFLLMDLDFHGAPLLSADLAAGYLRLSRDWPLYQLLDFYKCYRAYVRGKVFSFRLDDPAISPAEKAAAREAAKRYFDLALYYARRLNRPTLFLTCGLVGTGKSTIARALSKVLDVPCLNSDVIRKELAGLGPWERRLENYDQGIYAPDFSGKTYQALLERARAGLEAGGSVILDASFRRQADRREALALARQTGADFLLIECRTSEEEIRRRLERRSLDPRQPSDGRWELFPDQKKDFEPVEMDGDLHLILNTERPVEESLGEIWQHLLRRAARELPDPPSLNGKFVEKVGSV